LLGILAGLEMTRAEPVFSIAALSNLGGPGYVPLTGDYDGDGKLDPAAYQAASGDWYLALSSNNYAISSINLGGPGFTAVWGDYDGDGKADPAVYQSATGNWYARLSSSNYAISWMPGFGAPDYEPMPGDYDGAGETEMAVYQPSSGTWYLLRKETGEITDLDVLAGMYSNAMVSASNVMASKIRRDLSAINAENAALIWRTNLNTGNREVLVVSFMKHADATNYYRVGQISSLQYAENWVTLAPQLKSLCRSYTGTNLLLRVKQLLGLPATSLNDSIVEFYADPQYLLRPARDPEITDQECEVAFRTNTPYAAAVSTNYLAWFQNTIASRNYGMTNGVWNAYPWTQLGYTYDWSKTGNNVAGLSEYTLPGRLLKNQYGITAQVYVVTVTFAVDYAATPDNPTVAPRSSTVNIVRSDAP
jgi:hypothetical protein